MKPIFDEDFAGDSGLIKVWNNTHGYLDVSEEGHLLEGQKSAWVEETTKIIDLLETGELIGIGGYQNKDLEASIKASPKKKSKVTEENEISESVSAPEVLPVVQEISEDDIKNDSLETDVSVESI
jgi:hypothetical protein